LKKYASPSLNALLIEKKLGRKKNRNADTSISFIDLLFQCFSLIYF